MPVVYQLYFNKELFIFLIFIRRELIYNVVLVSGIQQSGSVIQLLLATSGLNTTITYMVKEILLNIPTGPTPFPHV